MLCGTLGGLGDTHLKKNWDIKNIGEIVFLAEQIKNSDGGCFSCFRGKQIKMTELFRVVEIVWAVVKNINCDQRWVGNGYSNNKYIYIPGGWPYVRRDLFVV